MCGIAGVLDSQRGTGAESLHRVVVQMANAMRARGPDDSGAWVHAADGVALSHRRLSIIDLSQAGHQPKESASGRYHVVFNGEIYNFVALRQTLTELGHSFRGHSDTEVLLAAIEEWGPAAALTRLSGMFALGLWDKKTRTMFLARDRAGEKPLYYGWAGRYFLFASELKAFRASTFFTPVIDPAAVGAFLQFAYVPTPMSIFKGVHKLPPGHFCVVTPQAGETVVPVPYWSAMEVAAAGVAAPINDDDGAIVDNVESVLRSVLSRQMVADVPLGSFLSGGVDSSLITALMQVQSTEPIRTFSIGFTETDYDEAKDARAVASHLGTRHTELYVTPAAAMAVIPQLHSVYDEPFADSSQIPTFLVAKLAREQVTVCLSGDAGDEVFGGYNRYAWVNRVWSILQRLPSAARSLAATAIHSRSPHEWSQAYSRLPPALLPAGLRVRVPGERLYKLAGLLQAQDREALYRLLVTTWAKPEEVLSRDVNVPAMARHFPSGAAGSFVERMMLQDFLTYLPDDILVKVDRAAMANSLETRVPFLDHELFALAWRLPLRARIRPPVMKWVLREILYRHVPRQLVDRPKMGFGIPVGRWIKGPLREWAEALLSPAALHRHALLEPSAVRTCWDEHAAGTRNHDARLWTLLMLQDWLEHSTRPVATG